MTTSTNRTTVDARTLAAQIKVPHPAPHIYRFVVTSGDVAQPVAHATNDRIVKWLGDAAAAHATAAGFSYEWLLARDLMWFVARHEIDNLAEAREGDHLLIATWVRSIRRVKAWRDSVIVRQSDNGIIGRASSLWVLVDLESRQPRSVSAEMALSFTPLESRVQQDARRPGM